MTSRNSSTTADTSQANRRRSERAIPLVQLLVSNENKKIVEPQIGPKTFFGSTRHRAIRNATGPSSRDRWYPWRAPRYFQYSTPDCGRIDSATRIPFSLARRPEALLRLGAKRVGGGEGPGHQRDTYLVLVVSGLDAQLRWQSRTSCPGRRRTCSSCSAVTRAQWWVLILSMDTMKPDVSRWPKNVLHWKGIHRRILDICATVPIHFVIREMDPYTELIGLSAKSFWPMMQSQRTSCVRD